MTPPEDVVARIDALPEGSCYGQVGARRYLTTRTAFSDNRAIKVVARELGGTDYISLNLYRLASGPRLYPCEMPAPKVIDFLRGFEADGRDGR